MDARKLAGVEKFHKKVYWKASGKPKESGDQSPATLELVDTDDELNVMTEK